MKKAIVLAAILPILFSTSSDAVLIGDYPGLNKLIDAADAIVIIRIDRHLNDFGNPTLYSTHECFVYQSLKGDIKKDSRITLQLMDTAMDMVTPYAWGATHLMFLKKKQTEDEPTEYRTLQYKGANVQLSPFGHEKMRPGETIQQKIRNLVAESMEYQAKKYDKEQKFLGMMLEREEVPVGEPDDVLIKVEKALRTAFSDLSPGPVFEYPKYTRSLIVKYRTRNFLIYGTSKSGKYNENAQVEDGPDYDGFIVTIHVQKAGTVNQAVLPTTIRRPYWMTDLRITMVKGTGVQLYWGLSYGSRTDARLREQIKQALMALE